MIYELWEIRSRNLVDDFDNEHDAIALAWENIKHNGPATADTLSLHVEEEAGELHFVASGPELAELARREFAAKRIAG